MKIYFYQDLNQEWEKYIYIIFCLGALEPSAFLGNYQSKIQNLKLYQHESFSKT